MADPGGVEAAHDPLEVLEEVPREQLRAVQRHPRDELPHEHPPRPADRGESAPLRVAQRGEPAGRDRPAAGAQRAALPGGEQGRERAEDERAVEGPEHELPHAALRRLELDPKDRPEDVAFHLLQDADGRHGG